MHQSWKEGRERERKEHELPRLKESREETANGNPTRNGRERKFLTPNLVSLCSKCCVPVCERERERERERELTGNRK